MCYAVFIATATPQPITEFVPDRSKLNLEIPGKKELLCLNNKFTLPYIYYVGSDMGCSCGFEFHSWLFDDPEWQDSKASPQSILDLLNELTTHAAVEYYCCWDGNWCDPIQSRRTLNIRDISIEKNYFELVEDEFILFENMT